MRDAKLCWVKREWRDEARPDLLPAVLRPHAMMRIPLVAFDEAPELVERRRCTEEGHGSAIAGEDDDGSFDYCPVAQTWLHFRPWETLDSCRFVTVFEVPDRPDQELGPS